MFLRFSLLKQLLTVFVLLSITLVGTPLLVRAQTATESVVFEQTLREYNSGVGGVGNDWSRTLEALWLPGAGGAFVLGNANCNPLTTRHGTWVYRDTGALVSERHLCSDVLAPGERPQDLGLEFHAWGIGYHVEPVSDTQFLRTGAGSAWEYPPLLYEYTGSTVDLVSKAWGTKAGAPFRSTPPSIYTKLAADDQGILTPIITDIAHVNGKIIASQQEGSNYFNVIYQLPNFTEIRKWSREIKPRTGLGGRYFLADENFSAGVYRLDGDRPVRLRSLGFFVSNLYGFAHDLTNNRIALFAQPSVEHRNVNPTFYIYDIGADGTLTEVRSYDADAQPVAFALQGEYFARAKNGKTLEVWKGDEKLSVDALPPVQDFVNGGTRAPWNISSIAISPTGKIIVGSADGVFLYRIAGFVGQPAEEEPPVVEDPQTPLDAARIQYIIDTYADFVFRQIQGGDTLANTTLPENQFISRLPSNTQFTQSTPQISTQDVRSVTASSPLSTQEIQKILNLDPQTRVAEIGAGSPGNETNFFGPLTQSALERFQVKHGIVSSGTPETTGFGNPGPRTRAKLIEVQAQLGT